MGGLLSRSTVQGDVKMKKNKRKRRHQQGEIPFESDAYLVYDDKNNKNPQIYYYNSHQLWEKKFDGQLINRNGKKIDLLINLIVVDQVNSNMWIVICAKYLTVIFVFHFS